MTLLMTLTANINGDPKTKPVTYDQMSPWSRHTRLKSIPADALSCDELFELMKGSLNG